MVRNNSRRGFASCSTAVDTGRIWHDGLMLGLMKVVVGLLSDALRLGVLFLRPSTAIRAENLVLRR